MAAQFILVKPYKSSGIAILLTLLFGPIGLFYASVTAGLMMTFIIPVFLIIFIIIAASQGETLFDFSVIFTLIVIAFYWLICLIVAVSSVNVYNRKIEEEYARQQQILNDTKHYTALQSQPASQIMEKSQTLHNSSVNKSKPNLQDWMRENPGKGINDYFIKFGN